MKRNWARSNGSWCLTYEDTCQREPESTLVARGFLMSCCSSIALIAVVSIISHMQ